MSSRVTFAAMPPFFSGEKSLYEDFYEAVTTYIAAYSDELKTDKQRIFFTLSLLRKADGTQCTASDWVKNWKKRVLKNNELPTTTTFAAFVTELEAAFKDSNRSQVAHLKLTTTRQGKMTLTEFFQNFELLAEQAGYTPNSDPCPYDNFLIELLEGLVNPEITGPMYVGGGALLTKYSEWRARLVQIEGNLNREKMRKGFRSYWPGQSHQAPRTPSAVPRVPVLQASPTTTTPTTHTHSPDPDAMDVDRARQRGKPLRCYNCGKFGHISRNCPDPPRQKFSVRSLLMQIEDGDKDSSVLKEIAEKLREKGF